METSTNRKGKTMKTKVLFLAMAMLMSLGGITQAAMDDVVVWDVAKSETELDAMLSYHPAGPAAMDDVRIWLEPFDGNDVLEKLQEDQAGPPPIAAMDDIAIWSGVQTQEQIEARLANGIPNAAQIDDVIVWDGVRSLLQINDTLVNGYSSTTGMVLWWDFEDPCLGDDATGNGRYGDAAAALTAATTDTPSGTGAALQGFSAEANYIKGLPQDTSGIYWSRTYEFWMRDPGRGGDAVFFSLTGANGGGDEDFLRLWVNADGSITAADRGYYTLFQTYTSSALTWEKGRWYQMSVVYEYTSGDVHYIRVYRGAEGDSAAAIILNYQSSSPVQATHYMVLGAHPQGYYFNDVGKGGFLEDSTLADLMLLWDFEDPCDLADPCNPTVTDVSGSGRTGTGLGEVEIIADEDGHALSGITTNDSYVWVNQALPGTDRYYDRTHEMWVRNPHLNGDAVFFSIKRNDPCNIDGNSHIKTLWVDPNGCIGAGDRGIGYRDFYTQALTWEEDVWYQVTWVFEYKSADYHDITIYRGKAGESSVEKLLEYESKSFGSADDFMSIGGSETGYWSIVAPGGHLGQDPEGTDAFLWWTFDDPCNIGDDISADERDGTAVGGVTLVNTDTPMASEIEGGSALTGFLTTNSRVYGLTDYPITAYYQDRTYQMWIRDPQLGGDAVFWAETRTADGGGDQDVKRAWINPDGSITMADRGLGIQLYTTEPLTWQSGKWYQISIAQDYTSADRHDMRLYRIDEDTTTAPLPLLDYVSGSFGSADHWISVGAHNGGYYGSSVGKAGALGASTAIRLWWDFSDPCDLGADASGHGYDGTAHGNAAAMATDTPSAAFSQGGMAASGFTSQDSLVMLNDPNGIEWRPYYQQQTYQMWIRNPDLDLPEDQKAVFMSLQGNTNALSGYSGDWDIKRFWVNEDGSVSAGDRGYYTGRQLYTSAALDWDGNAWYQISVVLSYTGADRHDIRVYRGKEGDSNVELLLDYESSSYSAGSGYWYLSVGGHPVGYYYEEQGMGGYLGEDGFSTITDCQSVIDSAYGLGGDITGDCYVGMADLGTIADQWLGCTDPAGEDCLQLEVVETFNILPGTVTVDGNLSDWADADWRFLDVNYSSDPCDISDDPCAAMFALKWDDTEERIYVATIVQDTDHVLAPSTPSNWNDCDRIEIYAQGDPNGGTGYGSYGDLTFARAQQYAIGINSSSFTWTVWGNGDYIPGFGPSSAEIDSAVAIDGDTLIYEVGVKMFMWFGGKDGSYGATTVVADLTEGKEVAFDVVAGSRWGNDIYDDTLYAMRSENDMTQKFWDAGRFRHWTLVGANQSAECGQWGYLSGDLSQDCQVDLADFAMMAVDWMKCVEPSDTACSRPWE